MSLSVEFSRAGKSPGRLLSPSELVYSAHREQDSTAQVATTYADKVWSTFFVQKNLDVAFHMDTASPTVPTCRGVSPNKDNPSFFTVACVNSKDIQRSKRLSWPLQSSAVRSACFCNRSVPYSVTVGSGSGALGSGSERRSGRNSVTEGSASPGPSGSVAVGQARAPGRGGGGSATAAETSAASTSFGDALQSGGAAQVAISLPTLALLLCVPDVAVLVLRPITTVRKKKVSVAYQARLRPVNPACQHILLSPLGNALLVFPSMFVPASHTGVHQTTHVSHPTRRLLCEGGLYWAINEEEDLSVVPSPLQFEVAVEARDSLPHRVARSVASHPVSVACVRSAAPGAHSSLLCHSTGGQRVHDCDGSDAAADDAVMDFCVHSAREIEVMLLFGRHLLGFSVSSRCGRGKRTLGCGEMLSFSHNGSVCSLVPRTQSRSGRRGEGCGDAPAPPLPYVTGSYWHFNNRWNHDVHFQRLLDTTTRQRHLMMGASGGSSMPCNHTLFAGGAPELYTGRLPKQILQAERPRLCCFSSNRRVVLTITQSGVSAAVGWVSLLWSPPLTTNAPAFLCESALGAPRAVSTPFACVVLDAAYIHDDLSPGFLLLTEAVTDQWTSAPGIRSAGSASVAATTVPAFPTLPGTNTVLCFVSIAGGVATTLQPVTHPMAADGSLDRHLRTNAATLKSETPRLTRFVTVDAATDAFGHTRVLVSLSSTSDPETVTSLLVSLPSLDSLQRAWTAVDTPSERLLGAVAAHLLCHHNPTLEAEQATLTDAAADPSVSDEALLNSRICFAGFYQLTGVGGGGGQGASSLISSDSAAVGRRDQTEGVALLEHCCTALASVIRSPAVDSRHESEAQAHVASVFQAFGEVCRRLGMMHSDTIAAAHLLFVYRGLQAVRLLVEALASRGAVSVLAACLSHLLPFPSALLPPGPESGPTLPSPTDGEQSWRRWCLFTAPLFDIAYMSALHSHENATLFVPHCTRSLRQSVSRAAEWFRTDASAASLEREMAPADQQQQRAQDDTRQRSAGEVLALVARGRRGMSDLSVADVYWTAKELFLTGGCKVALDFLSSIISTGLASEAVQRIQDVYITYNNRLVALQC